VIMLHYTRLMREGEVALWRGGKIVWQGAVGTIIDGVAFDAVSLNVEDGRRLSHRLGAKTITANEVLATIADWWAYRNSRSTR
jgi:hypothetical protein